MSLFSRLVSVFRSERLNREIEEEQEFHIASRVEELVAEGTKPETAARQARLQFGSRARAQAESHDARLLVWLESTAQDIHRGLRSLRKSPSFAAVAILTLALGIGANTAIFSVVQGVVLAPLPYQEPDRLVLVWLYNRTLKYPTYLSYTDFLDWKRNTRLFQQMAAFTAQSANLTSPGTPEHLDGKRVSWGFFSTLGVKLALGHEFTRREDIHGGAPIAVISNRLWSSRFARNPQALGRSVTLDGVDYTIVGVLPPDFRFLTDADVYLPLGQGDPLQLGDRATHNMACIARLKSDVSLDQAQAEMNTVQENLDRLYPSQERGLATDVVPLKQELVGDVRGTLLLLFGAVAVVLLIACANVANLLLARSAARTREFAVRSALGATGTRIVRQLVTESVILSLTGAAFGLPIARWGIVPLLAAVPRSLPRSENIGLNASVLLFAFGLSILVAVILGLAPARSILRLDLQTSLKEGGRTSTSGHRRTQSILVIAQMALTLVLLVGAGLLFRTVRHLWAVHPGFDTQHVISFKVGLAPDATDTPAKMRIAYQQLINRIREIPGVQAAAFTTLVPLGGQDDSLPFWLGSQQPASMAEAPRAQSYSIGPDYLKVMGIPLIRGRFFTLKDNTESAPVLVIDSGLAHTYFPDRDPVGQTMTLIHVGRFRIIGVVGHVRHSGLSDKGRSSRYQLYGSLYQISDKWLPIMSADVTVMVRTPLDQASILPAIKAAIYKADADQPIYEIRTMQQLVSTSMSQRFPLILMGTFAVLALLLASVGLYGVIAYSVAQRVQEIGIRMALGAGKPDVFRMILGQGLRLSIAGIALGGLVALLLARLVSSFSNLLYGVGAADPITFAFVSVVLTVVAVLACYIPARRAVRVDPMSALRHE